MANNIRTVVAYYNEDYLPDEISLLKKLIARKVIVIDDMSAPLIFRDLLQQYRGVIQKWTKLKFK